MDYLSVSVVLPVYNSEDTIITVLESVRRQTAIDSIIETIVINDGSTDASEALIRQYMQMYPGFHIRYYYQKNKGVSAARNVGLIEAKGDLIALIDSDDIWYLKKIEKQLDVFYRHPEVVFLGTGHLDKPFRRKMRVITQLYRADMFDIFWSFFPVTPSAMFRRSAIEKVGLFDETQRYCEDINFFIRFVVFYNLYYLPEKLVDIDIGKKYHGEKGLTSNYKGMHKGEMKNLKEVYKIKAVSLSFYITFYVFMNIKYLRRIVKFKFHRIVENLHYGNRIK